MDKPRPCVDVITIGDLVPACGVPVEQLPIAQLLEHMCRNGLMRHADGSYTLIHDTAQMGALVVVGHSDTDDDRDSPDSGDRQHDRDVTTGWDIDIDLN